MLKSFIYSPINFSEYGNTLIFFLLKVLEYFWGFQLSSLLLLLSDISFSKTTPIMFCDPVYKLFQQQGKKTSPLYKGCLSTTCLRLPKIHKSWSKLYKNWVNSEGIINSFCPLQNKVIFMLRFKGDGKTTKYDKMYFFNSEEKNHSGKWLNLIFKEIFTTHLHQCIFNFCSSI